MADTSSNNSDNHEYFFDKATALKRRSEQIIRALRSKTSGYQEQIKLSDDPLSEIGIAANNLVRTQAEPEQKVLADVLAKHNLTLYQYPNTNTSLDKQLVARMAFDGRVKKYCERYSSTTFKNLKNYPKTRTTDVKPDDYNLDNSTVWQVFKQVPEFSVIEVRMKHALATFGVPPTDLPSLKVDDFCFLLNEEFREGHDVSAKIFPESYKARNTKRFIKENEAEFRAGMMAIPGVDKNYVETLIRGMKCGLTDITKFKENGQPAWREEWKNQPRVDVHHITNVKDASLVEDDGKISFTAINSYENMCFVVKDVHDAMHAIERDISSPEKRENLYFNREIASSIIRIQPMSGVKCMLGFGNFIYDKGYLAHQRAQLEQKGVDLTSDYAEIQQKIAEVRAKNKEAGRNAYSEKFNKGNNKHNKHAKYNNNAKGNVWRYGR